MFELSVALKYLIPRWRQLSVSIISLISVFVIALVVWLIVVFFSVTTGLEKMWTEKLIALTAPIRLTPTEEYTKSHYFRVDSVSIDSNYTLKTIAEKRVSLQTNPYDPDIDPEIPRHWPKPDTDASGQLKDLVGLAFQAIQDVDEPSIQAGDYELTFANVRVRQVRPQHDLLSAFAGDQQTFLTQTSWVSSFDGSNPYLSKAILAPTEEDLKNVRFQLSLTVDKVQEDAPHPMLHRASSQQDQLWVEKTDDGYLLPDHHEFGYGALLAKQFRDSGVLVGDRGYLSFHTPTASSVQEQRIPFFVAGFYDPGVIPVGGKFVLIDKEVTTLIRAAHQQQSDLSTNGINVWFDPISKADSIKQKIIQNLQTAGVDRYWHVETYEEFEFTRDLLTQLRSDKNLYILIALIIIVVACSNIITLLILLVNDKRLEIGILRSMGAKASSIAMIFGFCGVVMAGFGSVCGMLLAVATLRYLNPIINWISEIQGYQAFNATFYGDVLPTALSWNAILFVIVATTLTSLIAGIIPAVKASLVKPASVLRSE